MNEINKRLLDLYEDVVRLRFDDKVYDVAYYQAMQEALATTVARMQRVLRSKKDE